MSAEECDVCGVSRSPAIEKTDDDGRRYVVCWRCDRLEREVGG
jgi:hypothetical protein